MAKDVQDDYFILFYFFFLNGLVTLQNQKEVRLCLSLNCLTNLRIEGVAGTR